MDDSKNRMQRYFHRSLQSKWLSIPMSFINIYVLYRCISDKGGELLITDMGLLAVTMLCTAMLYQLSNCVRGMQMSLKTGTAVIKTLSDLMELLVVWALGFGSMPVMLVSAVIAAAAMAIALALIYAVPMVFIPLFSFLSLAWGQGEEV